MSTDTLAEFKKLKEDESLQLVLDGKHYWVVEGDLLLSESELLGYAQQRVAARQPALEQRARLIVNTDDEGRIKRWAPGLPLSYAILEDTFGSDARYQTMVDAMHIATNDWESICGVRFEHRSDLDGGFANADRPLFVVEWQPQQKNYLALAFFPDWPRERRRIIIFDLFFDDAGFEPAGILRHELGHVLGFRHEQIHFEAPPGCPKEGTLNTTSLGPYDPQSVMHYMCGGVGSPALNFTDLDQEGARGLYGPPHHEVRYFS